LRKQGVERAILSTGHYAEQIDRFASAVDIPGMTVLCVRESVPLGTAGGFLHALRDSGADDSDVLVCNGDSLVLVSLKPLFEVAADVAVLGVEMADAARFGTLKVKGTILEGFEEKRPGRGLINGGVYVFSRETIQRFPRRVPLSFEYDVFPSLLGEGVRIEVVPCDAPFLDIGTEETIAQADAFIRDNMRWFE
jgi:NDP-sugar pyrophosphorylase family protein